MTDVKKPLLAAVEGFAVSQIQVPRREVTVWLNPETLTPLSSVADSNLP